MAGIKTLKKSQSGTAQSKQQENTQNAIKQIINKEIIDGILLKNVCLHAEQITDVEHGLGREPLGYIVTRRRADARVWDLQDFNRNKSRTLAIVASHDVTVDLWIF